MRETFAVPYCVMGKCSHWHFDAAYMAVHTSRMMRLPYGPCKSSSLPMPYNQIALVPCRSAQNPECRGEWPEHSVNLETQVDMTNV
jgi:hypothetical protein